MPDLVLGPMPRVSVIMPVRNADVFIAAAIESVLHQTLSDLELIVALDRSEDESESIARGFAEQDQRVVVMESAGPGLPAALNAAADVARAPLLARLDADDEAVSTRLAVQAAQFDEIPDLVLAGSPAFVIDSESREIGRIGVPSTDRALRLQLMRRNPFIHSSIVMRAPAFRAAGGYRDSLPFVEDYDLWLRMAGHGSLANIQQPLVRYRRHAGAVSEQNVRQQRLNRQLCFLRWKRDAWLIDAETCASLETDLSACYSRTEAIQGAPADFRDEDLRLFRRLLPRVGGGDARAMVKAVALGAGAGLVSRLTLARFRLEALGSRLAFDHGCRAAVRHLRARPLD